MVHLFSFVAGRELFRCEKQMRRHFCVLTSFITFFIIFLPYNTATFKELYTIFTHEWVSAFLDQFKLFFYIPGLFGDMTILILSQLSSQIDPEVIPSCSQGVDLTSLSIISNSPFQSLHYPSNNRYLSSYRQLQYMKYVLQMTIGNFKRSYVYRKFHKFLENLK